MKKPGLFRNVIGWLRRRIQFANRGLGRCLDRRTGGLVFLAHRVLERARRLADFRLQLLQFVELDFAVDVGFDVIDVALRSAKQMAESARHLG